MQIENQPLTQTVLYPKDIQPFKIIICSASLNRLLEEYEPGQENTFVNNTKKKSPNSFEFKCTKPRCKAYLKYWKSNDITYTLQSFCNQHTHEINEKINTQVEWPINKKSVGFDSLYLTEDMVRCYEKYHRCMYLTLTKVKNYFMLTFSCYLPTRDIGIFALALYQKPEVGKIKKSLNEFKLRRKVAPETIICNHQDLADLSKQYFPTSNYIMLDQQISQNYKVRYGFTKLVDIVTIEADWEREHRRLVTYIRECISAVEIREVFEAYRKLCIPFLPNTFIGLSINLFHALIIQQISEQKIFTHDQPMNFLASIPRKIKTTIQDQQMKEFVRKIGRTVNNIIIDIYQELQESVVYFLVQQQNKTVFCDINATPAGYFEVKYRNASVGIVELKDGLWVCDCMLQVKTGLPCCHILKMLMVTPGDIRQYIDPYWLPYEERKKKKQAKGRGELIEHIELK